jgi:hypothetical protein
MSPAINVNSGASAFVFTKPDGDTRITEDGDTRITEDGDTRITDE